MAALSRFSNWAARREAAFRWVLAGPGALLAGLLLMASLPLLLPKGAGGLDHLVFPLILAPLLWAVAFFYALLERDMARGALVFAAAILFMAGAIVAVFI